MAKRQRLQDQRTTLRAHIDARAIGWEDRIFRGEDGRRMFFQQHGEDAAELEWLNAMIANLDTLLAPTPRPVGLSIQDVDSNGSAISMETNAESNPSSVSPFNPRAFTSRDLSAHTDSTDGITNARGLPGAAAVLRVQDGRSRRDRYESSERPDWRRMTGEWVFTLWNNAAGFSVSATRDSTGETTRPRVGNRLLGSTPASSSYLPGLHTGDPCMV